MTTLSANASAAAKAQQAAAPSILQRFRELNQGRPSQKHVLDFTTQLAVMIRAGINLRAALDGIAEQTEHKAFKRVVTDLKVAVEAGRPFSEALAAYPKLFGPLYLSMVRASEMSGSFSEMLDRIAGYIAQQMETRKMVIGASIYPGVIGTLAVAVTVFLLTFVLPKFYAMFEGKEDVLPWATVFLMNLSKFVVANWPVLLVATIGAIVGLLLSLKTEIGALMFDRLKLTIPVMKSMFRALYISRSLQTFAQLIGAGVPMLDTIRITGEVSGNRLYSGLWAKVASSVKQGKTIAAPLRDQNLLPASVVQMVSAGEESGKLGEVLTEVAEYYAKRLKEAIKAVTGMIEPIMILVMGGIVGFIAMAIILPIFKMSQIVK
ncbi:MAG: type II secretion system F family protein [Planctomycetota bacterium]